MSVIYLIQDKVAVLKDLSLLMREDRSYRQKVLQKIPVSVSTLTITSHAFDLYN